MNSPQRRSSDTHWLQFDRRFSLGNVATVLTILGALFAGVEKIAAWYGDARATQARIESAIQANQEKQALRDDAINAQLTEIRDRLRVMETRLDGREKR